MIITKMALPRRTFLRGVGAAPRAAVPRRDDAGVVGGGQGAGAAARIRLRLAQRHHPVGVHSVDGRHRFRAVADADAAGPGPGSVAGGQRSGAPAGRLVRRRQRRSRARHRGVAERRPRLGSPRRRRRRLGHARRHRRSDCGRALRQGRRRCRRSSSCSRSRPRSPATAPTASSRTRFPGVSPSTPNPMEPHPRMVFERLFGEGGTAAQRLALTRRTGSLLDSVVAGSERLAEAARRRRSHEARASICSRCAKSRSAFRPPNPRERCPNWRCPTGRPTSPTSSRSTPS